jgi:hypothetical protein
VNGKPQFEYHVQNDLENIKDFLKATNAIDTQAEGSLHDPENLNSSLVSKNTRNPRAGSLARLGHLLDVQKVAGSSPVRPTTKNPRPNSKTQVIVLSKRFSTIIVSFL